MQLKSLFSSEKKNKNINMLNLKISELIKEIDKYFEKIRKLKQAGFKVSIEKNRIDYTQEHFCIGAIAISLMSMLLMILLPGGGILKILSIVGLTSLGTFQFLSKEKGFYKNEIKYVTTQTENLNAILKTESFKISLIINIENQFNLIEEKFKNNPETFLQIKNEKNMIIKEIKDLLIEEDINNLISMVGLLRNLEDVEKKTEKLIKLNALNKEVSKQLHNNEIDEKEEIESPEKFKKLL